jgi:hypothetical protein
MCLAVDHCGPIAFEYDDHFFVAVVDVLSYCALWGHFLYADIESRAVAVHGLCYRKFYKPVGRNGLPVAFTFAGLYGATLFLGHCGRGHN